MFARGGDENSVGGVTVQRLGRKQDATKISAVAGKTSAPNRAIASSNQGSGARVR